ncbi:carbon-nitrogen hydrolase family protein [Granulosicoccaceae sp. 1_MG-2023]|nr:carbon-nitrogen hydrolase family protein [Granulosicoccaceae sp. 1_MG-2023]
MTMAAAIQMASGTLVHANLLEAARLIEQAAGEGARLIVLPENFGLMAMTDPDKYPDVEAPGDGPMQAALAACAQRHGVWIVGGTIPLKSADPARPVQACLLFDDQGRQQARYDKIHLFDVALNGGAETYRESDTTMPGSTVVVADTPFGRLGLSVCYDLRFPELYRAMLDQGAEIFVAPSAFSCTTGEAHWETLLRARAIENSAYMIAAAQGGFHVNGRETWGHSMIVNPWGTIVGQSQPKGAGFALAQIDRQELQRCRRELPSVQHRVLHSDSPATVQACTTVSATLTITDKEQDVPYV